MNKNDQCTASPHITHFAPPHPCPVEVMGTPEPTHARPISLSPPPPVLYTKTRFYLIKSVIREMKMICFILKIRMSNCLLQSVTWQLYKLIQMVYTSRVILELFIEVLSHNKSLSNAAIGGPNTVNTNPVNVCKAPKEIFDELKEKTNWPSSQRNLNVNNEDVFGTQVEQRNNYKMVQFVLFVFHVVNLVL